LFIGARIEVQIVKSVMAEDVNKKTAPTAPTGSPAPAPGGSMPGMPAGNATPAAAPGMPAQSPMAGMPAGNAMPGMPPHVAAMMPRPYPNPQQMFRPVGMALAMRMQQMEQPMSTGQNNKKPKS